MAPKKKESAKPTVVKKRRTETERLENPDGRRSEIDILKERIWEMKRNVAALWHEKRSCTEVHEKWMENMRKLIQTTKEQIDAVKRDRERQGMIMERMITHLKKMCTKLQKDEKDMRKKIKEFEEQMRTVRANPAQKMNVERLEKERSDKMKAKEEMMGCEKELQRKHEQAIGETLPWKLCQICNEEYSNEGLHVPRILDCGHTLCQGCINRICEEDDSYVECPFDRIESDLEDDRVLPKNLAILGL